MFFRQQNPQSQFTPRGRRPIDQNQFPTIANSGGFITPKPVKIGGVSPAMQPYMDPQFNTNVVGNRPIDKNQLAQQSNGCCFIFMEAYNGVLPTSVRQYRDLMYGIDATLATGYKRCAKWLVPLMQRSNVICALVNCFMIKPLTAYGEWFYNNASFCKRSQRLAKDFWFSVWRILGK